MSEERFTIVFDGNLRGFNGNPFKADTAFGEPQTIALYDAIEQLDLFREALEKIAAMDRLGARADDLGRAARTAREALVDVGSQNHG
jgi:hypothetical protein